MKQAIQEKLEAEKAAQSRDSQPIIYQKNPESRVDEELFQKALKAYAEKLKKVNRMNLVSILSKGTSSFDHNEWYFSVENDIESDLLEKEKELLPFLRAETGVADLYLKLQVDPTYTNKIDQIPYTDEDKLKAMGEKNPSLIELQRIFKTRIVY